MLLRRHRRTTKENVQPSEMAVANVFKEVEVEEVTKVAKTTKKEGGTSGRGRSKAKA